MDKTKLMSFEKFNSTQTTSPYIFKYEKSGQCIFYFGSKHSYDPNNDEFNMLEAFWRDFLIETKDKNRIAFEEGGRRPYIDNKNEAISKYGEMGYLVHLATNEKIELFSPEPPEPFRFSELLKTFPKEAIAFHDFARACSQWNSMVNKPDFDTYIDGFLSGDKRESGWIDFDFSIQNMAKIQKDLFGTELDKNDKKFFYDIINPTTKKTIINEISRFEDEEFRDNYILEQIEKYWNMGHNIFIVYGSSHAIRQEPAIRTL